MKDALIAAITNYNFDNIKCFVNSIERSGFDGHKVMIVYNVPFSTVEELQNRDWNVVAFNKNESVGWYTYKEDFRIMCDRQLHYHQAIEQLNEEFGDLRYVMAIDPKDVIFQYNPSEWLEKNMGDKKINVGCESLRYRDEEWGRENLAHSFGEYVYERCKDNLIFNCGTVAGDWKTMSELFLNVYLLCVGSPNGTPDQSALNTLLSFDVYKNVTRFTMSEEGWACQAGTTIDEKVLRTSRDKLVEPQPYLDGDVVKTSKGTPFALVHQYDRIPEWKSVLEEKYK
ncbi:hypothetical protein UFOVP449_170 [uncultured Caudovirales phage]|uniref:Uncharacterized protein n=1 Tax=uncultured Caudovirales phage TaxID=2100421 RepID=A0A6J5MED3_9CAUD|nr:hypothetical protein UFOVP449_170 [uncultured Caudovirales phage]